MTTILRLIPSWAWLLIAALAAAGAVWLHLQTVTAELDAALEQVDKAEARAAVLQSALDYRRAQSRRLDEALTQRQDALASANEEIATAREALDKMERQDANVSDWAGIAVPYPVAQWVRRLRGDDSAGGDGTRRAEPSD